MKELFRVEKIKYDNWLNDYSLSVYEGDIIYVQCLSDLRLDDLEDIFVGNRKPDAGKIYVNEEEITDYNSSFAGRSGIYAASLAADYKNTDTVAEVLTIIKPPYRLFSKRKITEKLKRDFETEHISLHPDTPIWELDGVDRKKLGILKAKLLNARLVVLNIDKEVVEGRLADELGGIIRRMNKAGMTFLILSGSYSTLVNDATRIQLLHLGRAVKEWNQRIPQSVLDKLKYGSFLTGSGKQEETQRNFIGLYDYDWDLQRSFWDYLHCVKKNNPQIWEQVFQVILPEEGVGCAGKTVVIPRNSQDMLLEDLDIGQNLTLAASNRVIYDYSPVINRRLQRKIEETYYSEQKLPVNETDIKALSHFQKKVLSIARFAILHPAILFIEFPYYGIRLTEAQELRNYLNTLSRRGIKIVYFSKTLENMMLDCKMIIRTQDGMSAKIDTE